MRRFTILIGLFTLSWAASAAAAGKAPSADDLDKLMRKAGSAQQAAQKAISAGNQAEAKAQVAILKTVIGDAQGFWLANHKQDAVGMGKTVLAKLDALDKVVGAPSLDSAAAGAAIRDLGTACGSCHRVYRATDEENSFVLKPGTVSGY